MARYKVSLVDYFEATDEEEAVWMFRDHMSYLSSNDFDVVEVKDGETYQG